MSDIVLKVENVSKKFSRSLKRTMFYGAVDLSRSFLGLNQQTAKLRKGEFWAVKDVSFEVKKGETLGLIGSNGSGKSTLLKMLNGIFMPDKGKITVNGRVGALIEVGAGFHPLLTGRENIYINGSILGMNKAEIDKKFESIVDFADIGDFLDSPVKHYSSGMYVRLGFSVAIHSEPEILLIDEVLAVGDALFQAKCYSALSEMIKKGVSVVIVSHNMSDLQRIANRCLWIQGGEKQAEGYTPEVICEYTLFNEKKMLTDKRARVNLDKTPEVRKSGAKIVDVEFLDENGLSKAEFLTGEKMRVCLKYQIFDDIKELNFSFSFSSPGGEGYTGCWSKWDGFLEVPKGEFGYVELVFPELLLNTGVYVTNVGIWDKDFIGAYDWFWGEKTFAVRNPKPMSGKFYLKHEWYSPNN